MPRPPLRGENVTASQCNYVQRIEDGGKLPEFYPSCAPIRTIHVSESVISQLRRGSTILTESDCDGGGLSLRSSPSHERCCQRCHLLSC